MIKWIKNILQKEDSEIDFGGEGQFNFQLKIHDLIIGFLSYDDGLWAFQYSDAFKNQSKYSRLTGFSDLNKIYTSKTLWPFFKVRIPGIKQPMIIEIMEKEKLDPKNEASLLRRFGRKSMSNPYILELAN